jgi:hypothetical protein
MYDVIVIGGISFDNIGRVLGPFRLRTALENAGYSTKLIDYSSVLTEIQLLQLLKKLITPRTKVLGISASWFDKGFTNSNQWATDNFFNEIRSTYPDINIVIGGTKIAANPLLHKNADWFLVGFSDISIVKLLDKLSEKNTNLKYIKDATGVKIIESDVHYKVENMNSLETIFKKEDNFLPHQPLPIEIARGCIFKCSFCTHPFLGKKSYDYIRTAESLGSEFKRNYELFGTTRYFFSDDTFNDSIEKIDRVKRAIDIAKLPSFEFVGYIKPELLVTSPEMIPMLKDIGLRGAHFGIESLNHHARKLVGKGMEVQRIFDIAEQLRSSNNVKIHASLILGLPGDTSADFDNWQSFMIDNHTRLFSSWRYFALNLMRSTTGTGYSLIEKNPKTYGYDVSLVDNSEFLNWTSDTGLTYEQCNLLANKLNHQSKKIAKIAGWTLGAAWFFDIPTEDIENECFEKINFHRLAKIQGTVRAMKEFRSVVDTKSFLSYNNTMGH